MTEWIIFLATLTGAAAGFLKWVRPALREVMDVVRKANRVFDAMLQDYEIRDASGTRRVMFPDVIVHVLEWQHRHDEHWPWSPEDGGHDLVSRAQ